MFRRIFFVVTRLRRRTAGEGEGQGVGDPNSFGC